MQFISAYYHLRCQLEIRPWRGVLDTTLCDNVCQWLTCGGFLRVLRFTDRYDIAEILLKVSLNTINFPSAYRYIIKSNGDFEIFRKTRDISQFTLRHRHLSLLCLYISMGSNKIYVDWNRCLWLAPMIFIE